MFRNLLTRLFADDSDHSPLATQDAEVAIAALLVRVARADDRYESNERLRIDQVLARRRGLDMSQAAERRAVAEMLEAEAPDTVRFTRLIKDRVALEDRNGVIAAMWEIAYADDQRAAGEDTLIRLVASLLGIADRDSALIRQRVLGDLGNDPA
jgi:uncharacterized tellurite resistance protein B-like protein